MWIVVSCLVPEAGLLRKNLSYEKNSQLREGGQILGQFLTWGCDRGSMFFFSTMKSGGESHGDTGHFGSLCAVICEVDLASESRIASAACRNL